MNQPSASAKRRGHAKGGEDTRRLLWIAAILVGSTLLVIAAMYLLFRLWLGHQTIQTRFAPPQTPTLQFRPQQELATERAQQRARLQGYGWVDRRAGIARIPIRRAMQLWSQDHARLDPGTPRPAPAASARSTGGTP